MRSYLPDYPVLNPKTLDEALDALTSEHAVAPIAGGTDIMVYMESGVLPPTTLINLYALEDIDHEPRFVNGSLVLGPLTTYRHTRDPKLAQLFPMLATAAREASVLAVQSRATWIGNVANASPAADGVPALMAYDAVLELSSKRRSRHVPLEKFYRGYKAMDHQSDELITGITLVKPDPDWGEYYRKVGTRRFQAISKTLLAARIKLSDDRVVEDVRMVFASVAPFTLRATQTEAVLRGRALTRRRIDEATEAIQDEISPIDDIRSTETYRRQVSANLVQDFLSQALRK